MTPSLIEIIAAIIFAIAIIHTFATKFFEHLAQTRSTHAGLWHLLGEVEVVFGFWALILVTAMIATDGTATALNYIESRNFTEPMFVFAIMVIAGTRPILSTITQGVRLLARSMPFSGSISLYVVVLIIVPLLGSLITEPAAMTLAAMILANQFFARNISVRLKYATLGVLFVNISIGGTLTSFAAPPVLMVADQWGWNIGFMFFTFGWKAIVAVIINSIGAALLFRKELSGLPMTERDAADSVPWVLVITHVVFLVGVIAFSHHAIIFMAILLFFLGVADAYEKYQDRLILREGLLVAFFLAGLVTLGGQQQWWLEPVLRNMSSNTAFIEATLLTAFADNAALTYLGSLVEGLSDDFKYSLLAGAVTGGGLTIIANAPNPAGVAILRNHFSEKTVHPIGLLLAALLPTLVAALAFKLL